jgi:hypothetical protein
MTVPNSFIAGASPFTCGDCDNDGIVNVSDVVYLAGYIFAGGPEPQPIEAGEVNQDGMINITDAVYLIAYIFSGGPVPCAEPSGSLISVSSCQTTVKASPADSIPQNQDCIDYRYDGGNVLTLLHRHAAFNCCGEVHADVYVSGNMIYIEETETFSSAPCPCMCLRDLEFRIENLRPGLYGVHIDELYVPQTDDDLSFSLNLPGPTTGVHCVSRSVYPWVQ